MSAAPLRVVYDCMIFLQAAARPDRVHATMRLVRDGHVQLFLSPPIVTELRDVLTRPEVFAKFPALKTEHVDAFLADLLSNATMLSDVPVAFHLPRDPKDEPYLNLAIAANARYLVTWNHRHITYLMQRDTPEGIQFCDAFPDLQICDPPALVKAISLT